MKDNAHPTFGHGKICYIHIPALDLEISASFYQHVFNWIIRHREDGSVSFDDGVGEVSGEWVLDREPTPHEGFAISIMVDDIIKSMDAVTRHGGTILSTDLEEDQKMASFKDPAGNIMGLYQHHLKS